jgi:hypothetical protein
MQQKLGVSEKLKLTSNKSMSVCVCVCAQSVNKILMQNLDNTRIFVNEVKNSI